MDESFWIISTDVSWADLDEAWDAGLELLEKFKHNRQYRNEWYRKSRLCHNPKTCKYKNCLYAHSYAELLPARCVFGKACFKMDCKYWHPKDSPTKKIEEQLAPEQIAGYRAYLARTRVL